MTAETVLSMLPGSRDGERVLVVLMTADGGGSHLELRQQSFGEGIGWFTQSSVQLEPGQVADLRNALGFGGQGPKERLPATYSRVTPSSWQPRLVHADSA